MSVLIVYMQPLVMYDFPNEKISVLFERWWSRGFGLMKPNVMGIVFKLSWLNDLRKIKENFGRNCLGVYPYILDLLVSTIIELLDIFKLNLNERMMGTLLYKSCWIKVSGHFIIRLPQNLSKCCSHENLKI